MTIEMRQDKITGQCVIYAPGRGQRPRDFRRNRKKNPLPVFDENCPFCPGNEKMLPSIIQQLPERSTDNWQTQIVPNKYPILLPDQEQKREVRGLYSTMAGYGRHEVIIESPCHNQTLPAMPPEDVGIIVETYHKRYLDLMRQREHMMLLIFRNHGARAGTSLLHPHSQLVVTGFIPQRIRCREQEARRYFDQWGQCVYCDILKFEKESKERLVLENKSFLAFVPFAAESPFEIWIVPKRHQSDFSLVNDPQKMDLAEALRQVLALLYTKLNDPDYNLMILTSSQCRTEEPQLHWYVRIRPQVTTPAGFEIGTGISVNPSLPEENAIYLKKSDPDH